MNKLELPHLVNSEGETWQSSSGEVFYERQNPKPLVLIKNHLNTHNYIGGDISNDINRP